MSKKLSFLGLGLSLLMLPYNEATAAPFEMPDAGVISSNINDTLKGKYLKQYNNITFINKDSYHDRFIIIDRKIIFHSGASFKDLGKKCFAINEIENKIEREKLVNDVIKNCSIDN